MNKPVSNLVIAAVTCAVTFACLTHSFASYAAAVEPSQSRRFRFVYAGAITDVPQGKTARIWLPVAQTGHSQQVTIIRRKLPADAELGVEKKYGNRTLFFEAKPDSDGKIPFEIVYDVVRQPVTSRNLEPFDVSQRQKFLAANRLVPVDKNLTGVLKINFSRRNSATSIAQKLYGGVLKHMRYDKPAGGKWGRGDTLWACDSKFGNCTDFHSLFISMCRERHVPAVFEIGFPVPDGKTSGAVGGYHCWAMFAAGQSWTPVDISEADKNPQKRLDYFGRLPADRVGFTRGRDLMLSPPQQAGPVNFLVYPYVEIDGKVHTGLEKKFTFANVESPGN